MNWLTWGVSKVGRSLQGRALEQRLGKQFRTKCISGNWGVSVYTNMHEYILHVARF